MATYSVAAGKRGVRAKSLSANVEDVVDFADDIPAVEVYVESGTATVYFTTDRSTATVAGDNTDPVAPGSSLAVTVWTGGPSQIRLKSSAAAVYHVSKTDKA